MFRFEGITSYIDDAAKKNGKPFDLGRVVSIQALKDIASQAGHVASRMAAVGKSDDAMLEMLDSAQGKLNALRVALAVGEAIVAEMESGIDDGAKKAEPAKETELKGVA